MQRWKNYLFNTAIALNCLLLFLLIFENRMVVPAWLQVAGRMHPLVLHFPLVLVVLYALAVMILPPGSGKADDSYRHSTAVLLLFAAFTSVITALVGLFLSKEEGYDAEALLWHKWGGVAVSVFTLLWYNFNKAIQSKKVTSIMTGAFALVMIIFTGHQGAGITHGQNFLLAPIMPEKQEIIVGPEEAVVFAHMVKPILESKCMSCHNNKKAKGELVMETEDLLLKGGKSGALWDTAVADLGLLLRRVHLPIEQKKHMPPQGKPQLTDEEIDILTHWIRKGSNFDLRVAELPADDTLRLIAYKILKPAETASYDFDEADPADINKLNTENRVVMSESLKSPALVVNFFNNKLFKAEHLKELNKIKKQVVSLDLSKMPVGDEDLKIISELENLRKLNLSFTEITGNSLGELSKLKFLNSLSLSGTKVSVAQLQQLKNFPALKTVYAWNTSISVSEFNELAKRLSGIRIESGFKGDTMALKLSPPVLLNEETFINSSIPLKLKHYIQGATIRYTLDGTEPDSLHSLVFKGNETISRHALVKAKAFKPGWVSSDIIEASFYKNSFKPDTIIYLTQPNPQYDDKQGKVLTDLQKGEDDYRFGGWLGYRENRMECLVGFKQAIQVQSITLSTLVDVGGYIMPPQSIEIWGGDDPANLKRLKKLEPEQGKNMKPYGRKGFECNFDPTMVKCIKVVVTPVAKLPAWHRGKGDKGWVFVDEILVN